MILDLLDCASDVNQTSTSEVGIINCFSSGPITLSIVPDINSISWHTVPGFWTETGLTYYTTHNSNWCITSNQMPDSFDI